MANEPRGVPALKQNRLLSLMSSRSAAEFQKRAMPVVLTYEEVLHDAGVDRKYVYFPTDGIVSVLYLMRNGSSAEIGLIGSDGMVGIAAALGGQRTTTRAMVQVPGHALRIPTPELRKLIENDAAFRAIVLRYAQVLLTQATQTAVCNRYHTTLQQLSRWILQSTDLTHTREITMTQQLMAEMLGVRREAVSIVAAQLRADGVIDYSRGRVRVLDRKGLEARACECYYVVVAETRRLMDAGARR